jgi:predicted transcriptional regulator
MPVFKKICSIYFQCIPLRKKYKMKTLSLKLDDNIYEDAEEMTSKLNLARNRYINEAVSIYNLFNKRRLLKKQLKKESGLTATDSLEILREFEKLVDGN